MKQKIIHFGYLNSSITKPYIKYLQNNFNIDEHEFFLINQKKENKLEELKNIYLSGNTIYSLLKYYLKSIIGLQKSRKIILHGLFDPKLLIILFFMPWTLKKCYWIIWGGDLYVFKEGKRNFKWQIREFFRRPVIKNMGCCVSYIKGDFELAQKWYFTKARYLECLMYPSNLFKDYEFSEKNHSDINILVGNSADSSNNHIEIFEILEKFKNKNIKLFTPLSYGDADYANEIILEGKKRFKEKFKPITEIVSPNEYVDLLSKIDIAIFNHKRQRAMGNTISLLGLGKKVFMRSNVSQWSFFKSKGVKIFDINQFNIEKIERSEAISNVTFMRNYFSSNNYQKQLKRLFD